ncbi:hypothetical protein M23134_00820 [Microscilla marina ATCC 23134]|uniref:Uncharacterized protein n=1 Tax=Microscilla marina ATCC 23134 TaxID=313606 RepID=A1ZVY4_MICM2|nr:hypothetical protein M23134_00820 [Microscilla marina ATCC 23134]
MNGRKVSQKPEANNRIDPLQHMPLLISKEIQQQTKTMLAKFRDKKVINYPT